MIIKERLEKSPKLRKWVISIISSQKHPRPRFWVRWFVNPFFHTKGKGARINRKGTRMDLFPWHKFTLGDGAIVENQCIVNNGAGDIIIGQNTLIGIGSILTGPVTIGDNVLFGQRVFVSGFNHGYEDINMHVKEQPLIKRESSIGDDTFIGSNATIIPGVKIGKRCQIGAASVVTKDIPDYCVAVGNPAIIVKRYDFTSNSWISVKNGK